MNTVSLPDENQVKQVVLHYKKFYLSVGIIGACVLLLAFFIVPQIQQYTDQRTQVEEVNEHIRILEKNIATLAAMNQEEQTAQLATVLLVLPQDKDYAGILFAIKSAASTANVALGDFTFTVGELSAKTVVSKTLPTISMKLSLTGDVSKITKFITELSKTAPLINVSEIHMGNTQASIALEIYYKPIPQLKVNYLQPLPLLSAKNRTIFETVAGWQTSSSDIDISSAPEASGSSFVFGQ